MNQLSQKHSRLGLILLSVLIFGISSSKGQLFGAGSCDWLQGVILLDPSVMTAGQCVELGGDCCTSTCSSCNDGVGYYQDPADMNPNEGCRGCYYLGYKSTTAVSSNPNKDKVITKIIAGFN